jgi:hypothetical protein
MVEPRWITPGPADLACLDSEVFDVALFAWLVPVLQPVQPPACGDASAEIAVALEACSLIDSLARAVAVTAARVPLE